MNEFELTQLNTEWDVKRPTSITEWLEFPQLRSMVRSNLPPMYNFEIAKILFRLNETKSKHVVLQFPEGLLIWADTISWLLDYFLPTLEDVTIMGDVTYGACCIDDIVCANLGADFLVHFGHSCLVPIYDTIKINQLYVFVDIEIPIQHFQETVKLNFPPGGHWGESLALLGTVQYTSVLYKASQNLGPTYEEAGQNLVLPQAAPLSAGEVLGCTSPSLTPGPGALMTEGCCGSKGSCGGGSDAGVQADAVVFVSDGRFHIEAAMIRNPRIPFFRYCPFSRRITRETYALREMIELRKSAIVKFTESKGPVGLITSTLGRQGSIGLLERILDLLEVSGREVVPMLSSEIAPDRLMLLRDSGISSLIQIACPRLSIDWGHESPLPLLNPFEAFVALGEAELESEYPMDFYSMTNSKWSNRNIDQDRMGSHRKYYPRKRRFVR